jgi:hypothetical protein
MNSENSLSEKACKLNETLANKTVPLNFYDTMTMTYSGDTPLTGTKKLSFVGFYDGTRADVSGLFSVNQMEKTEASFFASTDPTTNTGNIGEAEIMQNTALGKLNVNQPIVASRPSGWQLVKQK